MPTFLLSLKGLSKVGLPHVLVPLRRQGLSGQGDMGNGSSGRKQGFPCLKHLQNKHLGINAFLLHRLTKPINTSQSFSSGPCLAARMTFFQLCTLCIALPFCLVFELRVSPPWDIYNILSLTLTNLNSSAEMSPPPGSSP